MKKVVLVSGAFGFVGAKLCRELLNLGYSVKAFDLKNADICSLPLAADGDVTDYPSLIAAFSGCHVIEFWIPGSDRFFSVNVGGLKNVVKAYKETDTVEKIIYTSSFFALGSTDSYIGDETTVHDGKHFCSEYEKSKTIADKIALEAAAEGVPVYPGLIYGPGKVTAGNSLPLLVIERFKGLVPGYFDQEKKVSFSHVDDVVKGHIAAMTKGRAGERYLLTGQNASFKHVFVMAAEISNTPKPQFNIPFSVFEAVAWFCILFFRVTGIRPLITPPLVDILRHEWAYSCEKPRKSWIIIPEVSETV